MLDQAFEALKVYDWGKDCKELKPIGAAIVASEGDAEARAGLEARLVEILGSDAPRAAKDVICRKLKIIGTAASVPTLEALLFDPNQSHMARYALESMPAAEAAQALRDALPKLKGAQKAGVIGSLGVRQDEDSVPALATLLADADTTVARAAAYSLGDIRSAAASKALSSAPASDATKSATTDASLACAESLLADGNKIAALSVYKRLAKGDQPKHVRLAATRGMLACAAKGS